MIYSYKIRRTMYTEFNQPIIHLYGVGVCFLRPLRHELIGIDSSQVPATVSALLKSNTNAAGKRVACISHTGPWHGPGLTASVHSLCAVGQSRQMRAGTNQTLAIFSVGCRMLLVCVVNLRVNEVDNRLLKCHP